jgi:MYXO-CTERM domain-containing protein
MDPRVRSHWAVGVGNVQTAPGSAALVLTRGCWTAHLGDATLDDAVNIVDLGILAAHYRKTTGVDWTCGDFTLDGTVNILDLGLLAAEYRWAAPPCPCGETVPEPAALLLLVVAGVPARRRRR